MSAQTEGGASPKRWLDRAGVAVAAAASAWFALAAAWELFGPFDAGHDAATAGVGIAAVEMVRWGFWGPVLHFSTHAPANSELYCHHPWGVFWVTALLVRVLGPHDWVLRLAPIAMSTATPPLIFLAARRLWGVPAAGLAAVAFTVTPLAVAFADFNALEVPVMFGLALAIWALVRFRETWRRRYLWVSLLGLGHALNSDWPAFVFTGLVLGLALVRGTTLARRWYPPIDQRRFWSWWALAAALAVLVLAFYLVTFQRLDQIEPLLRQAHARARGSGLPLAQVLASRRHWIELSFTPVGIVLGKLALPLLLARAIFWRRDLEVLPLAVLVMAVFQYVVFKQGADVHVFWPQYFALYLAYAVGALVASLRDVGRWVTSRWPRVERWVPTGAFALGLAPLLVMLPDAVTTLGYARRTGKRFDDGWRLIHQDADKFAVARHVSAELPPRQPIALHDSMTYSWALEWALGRPVQMVGQLPGIGVPTLIDSRFADPELLDAVAAEATIAAYGPFWFAVRSPHPEALQGYRLTRREPNPWERYFVNAHDPFFGVEPDPFWTWELRYHFFQEPNPPPTAVPADSEQLRIAQNVAVASGARALAVERRRALQARLHPLPAAAAGGLTLIGYEWLAGVAPRLRLYVLAAGPTSRPWQIAVTSRVVARPWSTVPAPDAVRQEGMPFAIPSTRFRPGFIYAAESEIREQPGVERYRAQLVGPDGQGALIPLFEL